MQKLRDCPFCGGSDDARPADRARMHRDDQGHWTDDLQVLLRTRRWTESELASLLAHVQVEIDRVVALLGTLPSEARQVRRLIEGTRRRLDLVVVEIAFQRRKLFQSQQQD